MSSIKQIVTAFMISAFVFTTFAQEKLCDTVALEKSSNRFCFMSPGVAWIDLRDMNTSLKSLQLSPFPEQALTLSLGGHRERGRWISETMTTLRILGNNHDSIYRTSLYMASLRSYTGFNVLPSQLPMNAFPYLGLGIGLNTLNIRSNEKSISDLLNSNRTASFLWQTSGLIDFGLGSEVKHLLKDKTGGLVIGLRLGYLVDFYPSKNWTSDGIKVTGLSSISQKGPYIHLILGGWDNKRKHTDCSYSL